MRIKVLFRQRDSDVPRIVLAADEKTLDENLTLWARKRKEAEATAVDPQAEQLREAWVDLKDRDVLDLFEDVEIEGDVKG